MWIYNVKKLYKNININEQSVHIHHLITTLLCIPPWANAHFSKSWILSMLDLLYILYVLRILIVINILIINYNQRNIQIQIWISYSSIESIMFLLCKFKIKKVYVSLSLFYCTHCIEQNLQCRKKESKSSFKSIKTWIL